jgi:hypothetical protein
MAEMVNVSSGLWPDSRRSNWELTTRRRSPYLAMVVGRAKDGSEKASPTPPLAKSSEGSTGTIAPSPPRTTYSIWPSSRMPSPPGSVSPPRSICMASLLSISMRQRLSVLGCIVRR